MRKIFIFTMCAMLLFASTAGAEPAGKLDVSVQEWFKNGSFDYYLHYTASSQILSKVSAPQNRNMTVFQLQYRPVAKQFVRLQYGVTGNGRNGRGADWDWTVEGSPGLLTHYGTIDFYGKEKMFTIDVGAEIAESGKQSTSLFIGWGSNKTYNELRNVVYHLIDSVPVGNRGQSDLGSRLDGHFYGVRLGIENNYRFDKKLSMDNSLVFRRLTAKAYGHWANHNPAWDWVDRGKTWGYEIKTGLKYAFTKDTATRIGYYYSYAKAKGIDELLDQGGGYGAYFKKDIDLRYVQRGYYFGFEHKF